MDANIQSGRSARAPIEGGQPHAHPCGIVHGWIACKHPHRYCRCEFVVQKSYITYANQAKIEELGVEPDDLATRGAVSRKWPFRWRRVRCQRRMQTLQYPLQESQDPPTKKRQTRGDGLRWHRLPSMGQRYPNADGTRAENKSGFVHFALLTAMRCWDEAMDRVEERQKEEIIAIEEALRIQAEQEAERERRDQAAEQAPGRTKHGLRKMKWTKSAMKSSGPMEKSDWKRHRLQGTYF